MSNQNINSSETIYVLNDKYQYDANAAAENAKWLDTNNVVSVKRDKTIYAVRAVNTYDFSANTNQEFFANTNGQSNLYQNFGSNSNQSILMTNSSPIYGNISASQVGVAGSLFTGGFNYVSGSDGSINVDSIVNVISNGRPVNSLPNNLQKLSNGNVQNNAGFGNVINNTCDRILRVTNNDAAPVWNRLINARLNGNALVNCSTDPCDLFGRAIPSSPYSSSSDAVSNELYREQLAVKLNSISPSNLNINNPSYIASVSQFGSNLSGTAGVVENMTLHSFSGNFFANLPADNVIYANGNVLTGLSISGSVNNATLSLFNSNVLTPSNPLNGVNLNNAPAVKSSFNNVVSVEINTEVSALDTLANSGAIVGVDGNVSETGTFTSNENIMITQGDITISPLYLMDRLSPSNSSGFVIASNIFSNGAGDNRSSSVTSNINSPSEDLAYYSISANLQSGTNVRESSAKYLYLTGKSIQKENWQLLANVVEPVAVPYPAGIPSQSNYVSGNVIDIYVQKGSVGVSNYTPYANKDNSGNWVKSIPSFMNSFNEPSGNAYLDNAVFGNTYTATKDINIGNVSNPINVSAGLVDNYNFYFFGNTASDSRTNKRVGNVVANTSSIMADLWSYNSAGVKNSAATTQWSPMVIYGDVVPSNPNSVVRPLTLLNEFSKANVDYKLEFPSYVGKTNAPSSGNYSFFANISYDGLVGNTNATSLSQFKLDNNSAVNDILLNDVVSTTFTVKSNSYKYTDIGTVVPQNTSNSEFNAVLPFAGNVNSSNSSANGYAIQDVAMNVIVDYFQNPVLLSGNSNNVHRLTIFDVQYRYAITSVARSGALPLNTKITINGSDDVVSNLMVTNGNISASQLNDYVLAPEFTLFTYDNVSEFSSSDALYPFTTVTASPNEEDRWFPGFNYRQSKYYSSKTDAEADFTIDANTVVENNVVFLFQAINTNGKTVSVAKSTDNAFKSIPIRRIKLGSQTGSNLHPYYGYIIVKVLGETSSYVIILYKLNAQGTDYDSQIGAALPVMVNVKSIELSANLKQQVEFKSAIRVYDPSNSLVQSFTNTVNSHKSPLSLFNYSTVYGSNDTSVGVNTYSAPSSNAIMQWAYKEAVIQQLVEYDYVNKSLDGMSGYKNIPSQTAGTILFAMTSLNTATTAVADSNAALSKIPALSKRCYLDSGVGSGVYIDILNTYVLSQPIVFSVDRSVEWVLKRKLASANSNSYEVVGRGLMSHARNQSQPYEKRDYLVIENDLTKPTSGFQMTVNTNVVDLSARLLAQDISKGPLKNGSSNELALNIRTVPDQLSMVIYKVNPVNGVEDSTQFGVSYNCDASSSNIDLAQIKMNSANYNGQLPSFSLSSIRGYQQGEIANRTNALFSINYSRDNYAIIQLFQNANKVVTGGRLENSGIVFSRLNLNKYELYCNLLDLSFNNVLNKGTLNRDFAPLDKAGNFFKYASYKHNGFGSMSYAVLNFTSNYGKTLPPQEITSGSQTPVFAFNSNDAYKVSTPVQTNIDTNILYENSSNKYYAEIVSFGQTTKVYFRGTGLDSLPTQFNNTNTLLLYTGTRPIVVSSLTMAEGATLNDMRANVAIVNASGMFNTRNWLTYNSDKVVKQSYGVLFTNSVQADVNGFAYIRSLKVTPKTPYFAAGGNFYLGAYINSSDFLTNNFVNVSYSNGSYRYPFYVSGGGKTVNPCQPYDSVSNSNVDTNLYNTFLCKNLVLGDLFLITLLKTSIPAQSYNITINPATVRIYEAIDANNNGELDVNYSTNAETSFGLDAAFSELLYTLTPVSANTRVDVPKVVDSWSLDRLYHNIKGSSLDINMNVKWNVGYNLGNFFTIRQNNVAEFNVITVHTEYNSSANNKNMTNLIVSPVSKLVVGNKNSWARAPQNGDLSGLSFKLNGTKVVKDEIIRLFVDNQVQSNNTLSFAVGNKTYKLSSYDQERYAALLDEQIRFTNNIE
jgi:hypothetical protein